MGLGMLGLCSPENRPAEADAVALLHFAFGQGVRLIDTANVYCKSQDELHYGESLVREAIATWPGPSEQKSEIKVLTKVGMARHSKGYKPAGSSKQIKASVEGSLRALGVDQLYLLQLHVRDPAIPFEEQLAALAELQAEGKALHLGLCNLSPEEVCTAQKFFTVATIQNELNIRNSKSVQTEMLNFCEQEGIPFLAYRPLGGAKQVAKYAGCDVLVPLAERHGVSPAEVALAAILDLNRKVIPLVGSTRLPTLKSCLRATSIQLTPSDRLAISLRYPLHQDLANASRSYVTNSSTPALTSTIPTDRGPSHEPEVVLLMGIQGAGKSEFVQEYVGAGYARLNRDELGGTLDGLVPRLSQLLAAGQTRVVLDNTYASIASRASVIRAATFYGIPVRCRHLQTSYADARINVCLRMIGKYGLPLGPNEMKQFQKVDPNLPPPQALDRYISTFEPPSLAEGFAAVDLIPFERRVNPNHKQKGLLLDADGTLRLTKSGGPFPVSPDDIRIMPRRQNVLEKYVSEGYQLFIVSNQGGISVGDLSHQQAQDCFYKTVELLGVPFTEITYCPHPYKPVGCYCRKPGPGLGVYVMEKYGLDRNFTMMVGDRDSDAEFAAGLGIEYRNEAEFFANEAEFFSG
jgi:histidinol-phosphate phosphatase family protein